MSVIKTSISLSEYQEAIYEFLMGHWGMTRSGVVRRLTFDRLINDPELESKFGRFYNKKLGLQK